MLKSFCSITLVLICSVSFGQKPEWTVYRDARLNPQGSSYTVNGRTTVRDANGKYLGSSVSTKYGGTKTFGDRGQPLGSSTSNTKANPFSFKSGKK